MARLRRRWEPGAVHHAISRFHNGAYRLGDQEERNEYLRRLATALDGSDWVLLAFALMSTHIHLVLLGGLSAPGSLIQKAHSPFARWLNSRQETLGHLFAGRFRLWAIRRSVSELIAYVHNNPVRANVVPTAASSPWTSHRFYLAPSAAPAWLDVKHGMRLAGFSRGSSFDDYVRRLADQPRDPIWRGETDRQALERAREAAGAAIELGEPSVGETARYEILRRPESFAEARHDYSAGQVIGAVERVLAVSKERFRGSSKTREATQARRLALRVWRRMRGPQAEMCAALGMSSSAACGLLESRARRHRFEDEERVWRELLRTYPQKI